MKNTILVSLFSVLFLVGCSSHSVGPISAGQNSYVISKQLASFATKEEDLLASIFSQANEHCLEQKRYLKVEQLNEYVGLIGNDSKTTLIFSCLENVKKAKKAPTVKAPVKKQTFPTKNKLNKYAF